MTTRISSEALRAAQMYTQNANQTQRKNVEQATSKGLPADKVELSPQARELGAAMRIFREADAAASTDEGREAKLAELAQRVQNGTYRPAARNIASRLGPALRALNCDSEKS